jgi:hypothetical protein
MDVRFVFNLAGKPLPIEAGYKQALMLIAALRRFLPGAPWHAEFGTAGQAATAWVEVDGWGRFLTDHRKRQMRTPQDVSGAGEVVPIPEKLGCMVVALRNSVDLCNPQYIQQAAMVEGRLTELDALSQMAPLSREIPPNDDP